MLLDLCSSINSFPIVTNIKLIKGHCYKYPGHAIIRSNHDWKTADLKYSSRIKPDRKAGREEEKESDITTSTYKNKFGQLIDASFRPIFSTLGPLWATLGKFGPIWAGLDHFGQVRAAD